MAYDFHYTPTGTGVISGKEVLEQTEDAINDLGNTAISGVQEALDKAEQALTNSENAVDDAQTALNTANNAEGVAIQAQTDVGNLSGTVANIGNRVTTAEGNISNLQGRMTTAEGNITNLQGRMTTAEGNIGNLQTAVSTAQATANSAQQTATTARQQSYVFRYSSTALVASSTNSNTLLDNTDNLKVGDKVIDSSGVLFSITAIDTVNSTFTVGSALIDLALDANVVHTNGVETVTGTKTFSVTPYIYNSDSTENSPNILFKNSKYAVGDTTDTGEQRIIYADKNGAWTGSISSYKRITGTQYLTFTVYSTDSNNATISSTINYYLAKNGSRNFSPNEDSLINLGSSSYRWKDVYATNYYYGSNNVEFSTKFVTTDTNQTITGSKTFEGVDLKLKSVAGEYTVSSGTASLLFYDKNSLLLSQYKLGVYGGGIPYQTFSIVGYDSNNQQVSKSITLSTPYLDLSTAFLKPDTDNAISLGRSNAKWSDVQTYKVNGVEPSSLSLPSDRSARIDISSYITNLDNGSNNQYIVPANGYIWLHFTSINSALCYSQTSGGLTNYAQTFSRYSGDGQLYAFFPVRKNDYFIVQIYTSSTAVVQNAYFIPCQGNV